MQARIVRRTGERVQELILRVGQPFDFAAGQYLEILLPENGRIPLSIASAPHRLPELHLHYRSTPGVAEAAALDELLETRDVLDIAGPYGDVRFEPPLTEPVLIAAGGTGASQALALIDALVAAPPRFEVSFLWCADCEADLYRRDWLASLDAKWLTTILIADPRKDQENEGMVWLRTRSAGFRDHRIFLCGGPPFVYAAVDALEAGGVPRSRMAADAFSYAPRPESAG